MDLAKADSLLKQLLELPAEERPAHLDKTCGDDPGFKAFVSRLLVQATAEDGNLSPGGGLHFFGVETSDFAPHGVARAKIGDQVGAFRLIRELGQGGMATVYLAERADGQFEQQVAIKVLDRLGETAGRFEQERQILASLDHPNIARLLDGGVTEHGAPYVVMEYVEGIALLDYCTQHELNIEERIRLFVQVADAVNDAHRKLIVHRDIKSANVLVNATGTPKLLDFGIAKLLGTDVLPNAAPVTQMAAPMTPEYASPEQVRGEPLSVATDVYQLGFLLYLLLTGRSPYDVPRRDLAALIHAITDVAPMPPSRRVFGEDGYIVAGTSLKNLAKALNGDLDRIVLKALHKDPRHRYSSAEALAEDLENVLSNRPIAARPDSLGYRTKKFVQRRALAVTVSAIVAVSVVAGASAFTYQLALAEKAATLEAAKANQVTRFLMGLFSANNPAEALGSDITASQLLVQGLKDVEALDDEPAVQAQLLVVLGNVYLQLGQYEQSQPLLERALAIREVLFAPPHGELAESLTAIGNLKSATGEHVAAESSYRRALTMREALFGPEDSKVAEVLQHLAWDLSLQGRLEEAEVAARRSLSIRQTRFGSRSLEAALSANVLGNVLTSQGELDSAEALLRRVLEVRKAALPETHPDLTDAMSNLSGVLFRKGDLDGTLALLSEKMRLDRNVFGEEHPEIVFNLKNLGTLAVQRGELREAEQLLEEAYIMSQRVFGDQHPQTASALHGLGGLYVREEKYVLARPRLEEARKIRIEALGAHHPDVASVEDTLGVLLLKVGAFPESSNMLKSALDKRRIAFGNDHANVALSLNNLAMLSLETGNYAESESQLLEALRIAESAQGAGHPRVTQYQRNMVKLYNAWGKPEQAAVYAGDSDHKRE